jgi:hypothetical protein
VPNGWVIQAPIVSSYLKVDSIEVKFNRVPL